MKAMVGLWPAATLDREASASDAFCSPVLRSRIVVIPTAASEATTANAAYFCRRRRARWRASSIRASTCSRVTGSLGRGGRGGAVTVASASLMQLR
jgi:hypothetical protein